MTPMSDDREIIDRHLAGDKHAFEDLIVRYERRVWAICLRMCGNPDDARDASQDTFVTALRAIGGFRGEAALSTWLHRIAVNASLDVIRKRGRAPTPVEEVPESTDTALGPDDEAIRADRSAAVHRALAKLSVEHRTVIVLHDLQGMQYPDVAATLDVPVGTVKSRLHRARMDLARLLGHLKEPSSSAEPHPQSPPLR